MTNTRNTPVEALEYTLPLRVRTYELRDDSGGKGRFPGGNGIRRTYEFLAPATVTINSERRLSPPYGLQGGSAGHCGNNILLRNGNELEIGGKWTGNVRLGDWLVIETPGGGGWGTSAAEHTTKESANIK
jgi:N-methylhydantoinase B